MTSNSLHGPNHSHCEDSLCALIYGIKSESIYPIGFAVHDVRVFYRECFMIGYSRFFCRIWEKREEIVVHTPLQRNVETVEIGTIAIFFSRIAMLSRVSQVSRVGFSLARASSTARVWVDKNTKVIGQGITGKNVG